jgi:hypothetical protein
VKRVRRSEPIGRLAGVLHSLTPAGFASSGQMSFAQFPHLTADVKPKRNGAMKKRRCATRRAEALRTNATASSFVTHVDAGEPGRVILYLRVSSPAQADRLTTQEENLRRQLENKGCSVVAVYREIGSGWAEDRTKLERAALRATEVGAVLAAESVCRFLRSFSYQEDRKALPNMFDMARLVDLVHGAKLATLLHPDTDWKLVRGHQSQQGQVASGCRGGRPRQNRPGYKKATRQLKLPEVMALYREGLSYRAIGRVAVLPWSTVRDWIKNRTLDSPRPSASAPSTASCGAEFPSWCPGGSGSQLHLTAPIPVSLEQLVRTGDGRNSLLPRLALAGPGMPSVNNIDPTPLSSCSHSVRMLGDAERPVCIG